MASQEMELFTTCCWKSCLIACWKITVASWMNALDKNQSAFRDWLKDKVRFQIEAAEMANEIEPKPVKHLRPLRVVRVPSYQEQSRMQNFHTAAIGKELNSTKPPCSLCQSFDHGVWFCKEFYDRREHDCWKITKEKKLCFHCLASDYKGKDCPGGMDGCSGNHHCLLHGSKVLSETGPMTM